MDPHSIYKQASVPAATRIDLLLAMYDGAIERIAMAMNSLREGNRRKAVSHLLRAELIVAGLASGVRTNIAPHISVNILRLYEFVVYQLSQVELSALSSALKVLSNLREGFEKIRAEARDLERSGKIPPIEAANALRAIA
jgi:flagellar protein FliS